MSKNKLDERLAIAFFVLAFAIIIGVFDSHRITICSDGEIWGATSYSNDLNNWTSCNHHGGVEKHSSFRNNGDGYLTILLIALGFYAISSFYEMGVRLTRAVKKGLGNIDYLVVFITIVLYALFAAGLYFGALYSIR